MPGLYMPEKIPEDCIGKIKDLFASESPAQIPQKITNLLQLYDRFNIDIAVTGESGSGKSSLINVFLGLSPDDVGAAQAGVVETTMKATMYQHPNFPQVRLWDLPGMGTPSFNSKSYVKAMNLESYDMFIVVISERVRENNMLLVDTISQQKKPFYVIRTKIDNDMRSQRRKRNFSEANALNKMKEDCEKYLKEKNLDNPVFLVSAHEPLNYEMPRLMDTFKNEVPQIRAELFVSFLDKIFHRWFTAGYATQHAQKTGKIQAEDVANLHSMYKETGFGAVKVKAVLDSLNHFQLDVAVLGETGSGTSTLVNALTRMEKDMYGAASAFIGNPAVSSEYQGVRFWDMSGIEAFMTSMYEMKQNLRDHDFFILIVSDWQEARHVKLAKAVMELRRHFLLVQTKIDCHLRAQGDLCCAETEMLDGLRAQYTRKLQRAKLLEPQIFLINSLDRDGQDFMVLESALAIELDAIRTIAFAHYIEKILRNSTETCPSSMAW
ncbi:uncharacterized protein irgq1 [Triplophysa rosa]|uniref:uncharacterized protein irgq1 n=1 Tax=Triplophysa rosa TaxID=992332 RepID=UPI0025462C8E|nr:uncharacterized protein irgq1 [Triplophysa rosa]